MNALERQLTLSVELQSASPELREFVKNLQRDNIALKAEVNSLNRGRDEFDLDGDSLPAFLRPQA